MQISVPVPPMTEPNIHLILHNTIAITSVVVSACLIVFLLFNGYRKAINITLVLTSLAVIVFVLSHVIGVSVEDHELSRMIFMANISVIFISVFNYHCVIVVLKKFRDRHWLIYIIYTLGIGLALFYVLFPDLYLKTSVPKMYFPNYYVPGSLDWIGKILFQIFVPMLFIYELLSAFRVETDEKERKRIKYLTIAIVLGWTFGQISTLLVYNIPVDPMYGIYFPILFCIPFTYAVLNHDLLDIRIVAKRAFYYGILVAICAVILIFMNFLNKWVEEIVPGIPIWVVPIISSVFAVAVGIAVWRKVREADTLKYNFINKTMHELRTPLTHIKLASENLEQTRLDEKQKSSLTYIEEANEKLIKLTDLVDERAR
jgi:hypothetical protein